MQFIFKSPKNIITENNSNKRRQCIYSLIGTIAKPNKINIKLINTPLHIGILNKINKSIATDRLPHQCHTKLCCGIYNTTLII